MGHAPALRGSVGTRARDARERENTWDKMQDREAAQHAYRMVFEEIDPTGKEHICKALLDYCERDTLARVEFRTTLPQTACLD